MRLGGLLALSGALVGLMACEDTTRDDGSVRSPASNSAEAYTAIVLPDGFVPVAVNRSLMVVGSADFDGAFQPARWTPEGGTTALPVSRGWTDVAVRDLNEQGQVAGVAGVASSIRAVRWEADDTPRALGLAYYIPGSALDEHGAQGWVQVLGPFSNPTGYDIRFWALGRELSRGRLPFQPDDNGDQFAPFRMKENGVLLWGFGRWLFRPQLGWKQLRFPADVISGASLTDANRSGEAIGTGFSESLNYYRGFFWDGTGKRAKVGDRFLPQLLTTQGLIAGHQLSAGPSPFPAQLPGLSDERGSFLPLPVPPPPPNYTFAYGWVFDLTDDGTAVGSVIYYDLTDPNNIRLAGGGVLWVRRETHAEPMMASLLAAPPRINPVPPQFQAALCSVPAAVGSGFCENTVTPLSRQKKVVAQGK